MAVGSARTQGGGRLGDRHPARASSTTPRTPAAGLCGMRSNWRASARCISAGWRCPASAEPRKNPSAPARSEGTSATNWATRRLATQTLDDAIFHRRLLRPARPGSALDMALKGALYRLVTVMTTFSFWAISLHKSSLETIGARAPP